MSNKTISKNLKYSQNVSKILSSKVLKFIQTVLIIIFTKTHVVDCNVSGLGVGGAFVVTSTHNNRINLFSATAATAALAAV